MSPELRQSFERRFGIRPLQCYGSAETVAFAVSDPPGAGGGDDSVGTPLAGVAVRVLADDGTPLPPGEIGEIAIGSDGTGRYTTMKGYWRNPEATAEAMPGGFTKTGDVGYLDEHGGLHLSDRKKDMIFAGGWTIFPGEVERVLLEHPAVEHAAVVGVPDARLGEVPRAYVQLHRGAIADAAELIRFCRSRLAHYKAPREVEFVESMPRNALGKIVKRELRVDRGQLGG